MTCEDNSISTVCDCLEITSGTASVAATAENPLRRKACGECQAQLDDKLNLLPGCATNLLDNRHFIHECIRCKFDALIASVERLVAPHSRPEIAANL